MESYTTECNDLIKALVRGAQSARSFCSSERKSAGQILIALVSTERERKFALIFCAQNGAILRYRIASKTISSLLGMKYYLFL